jgi:hypothetical protein
MGRGIQLKAKCLLNAHEKTAQRIGRFFCFLYDGDFHHPTHLDHIFEGLEGPNFDLVVSWFGIGPNHQACTRVANFATR